MHRALALLLLLILAGPVTCMRSPVPPRSVDRTIAFVPLDYPHHGPALDSLGAFKLDGVWRMDSPHYSFGGFSGLASLGDGTLLAVSDFGIAYRFSPPGSPPTGPWMQWLRRDEQADKRNRDSEAVTADPATGVFWIAWEDSNAITRHAPGLTQERLAQPPEMADWGNNTGPESLVRLADGRFITLREGFSGLLESRRHVGLLFAGDPTESDEHTAFTFDGPRGFSPTDMAELPDGRVLILMRRVVWPLPAKFAGRIVLADPADIREGKVWRGSVVARLTSTLPIDNFEGLTVEPEPGGKLAVWLISDDNAAVMQDTILWKLTVDPEALKMAN